VSSTVKITLLPSKETSEETLTPFLYIAKFERLVPASQVPSFLNDIDLNVTDLSSDALLVILN
jgi:hypothetical protein